MAESVWDVPKTEEGLQYVLGRLEECRLAGDDRGVGNGLMAVSFLVKWVRSDNGEPAFQRSHALALEAIVAFRRAKDEQGLIRALLAAAAMADPDAKEAMFLEAENLAKRIEDENSLAKSLAARARSVALENREQSTEMYHQALEIFRRTGDEREQARCLFGLSIGSGTTVEKRDMALEAARLNRANGQPDTAARCMTIALMNAEEL